MPKRKHNNIVSSSKSLHLKRRKLLLAKKKEQKIQEQFAKAEEEERLAELTAESVFSDDEHDDEDDYEYVNEQKYNNRQLKNKKFVIDDEEEAEEDDEYEDDEDDEELRSFIVDDDHVSEESDDEIEVVSTKKKLDISNSSDEGEDFFGADDTSANSNSSNSSSSNNGNSNSSSSNSAVPAIPAVRKVSNKNGWGTKRAKNRFKWLLGGGKAEPKLRSSVDFFNEYFEQKPFYLKRNDPTYYENKTFKKSELDKALKANKIKYGINLDVTSYQDKRYTFNPKNGDLATAKEVWDAYDNKSYTLRVLHPQLFSSNMWSLCSDLQQYFGCVVGANIYMTPPKSQGFAPHYDDVDVFILQLQGQKRWRLYPPRKPSEQLPRYSSKNFNQKEIGKMTHELVLEPGDLLYLPRGVIHQAYSTGDVPSIHATVSTVQRWTWRDYLDIAVPQALEHAFEEDIEFRKVLPKGFFNYMGVMHSDLINSAERRDFNAKLAQLFTKLASYLTPDTAADQMAIDFLRDSLPLHPTAINEQKQLFLKETQQSQSAAAKKRMKKKLKKNNNINNNTDSNSNSNIDFNDELTVDTVLMVTSLTRIVVEDDHAHVYHNANNTRNYQEIPHQYIQFPFGDIAALEFIFSTFPSVFMVDEIPFDDDIDKIEVASSLLEAGIIQRVAQ